ncbi:ATP-dependent RNA helicase DDX24-like isoform X2 [Homarus americanus]|uniref:ATP-dependent RNA helicase DDX24-like isoform X2 n=1 Tax=Homarus americanus TaxID=6706 RepID=UPI001C479295|nr:ATP-dependent RNA helicase DDX24-like isoform X2 [Homarus americanus]
MTVGPHQMAGLVYLLLALTSSIYAIHLQFKIIPRQLFRHNESFQKMGKNRAKTLKKTGDRERKNAGLLSGPVLSSLEFEGLAGFEEVSSCTLMKLSKQGQVQREVWEDGKIVKKKEKERKENTAVGPECEIISDTKKERKKKKKKTKTLNSGTQAQSNTDSSTSTIEGEDKNEGVNVHTTKVDTLKKTGDVIQGEEANIPATKTTKKRKKQQPHIGINTTTPTKKACYDRATCHKKDQLPTKKVDVSAWEEVFAPPPVLEALAELGFSQPTEIQKLVLPAAIKGLRDIIGAAETGSGKTLAFGIPIINGILNDKMREAEQNDSGVENSDVEFEQNDYQFEQDGQTEENVKDLQDSDISTDEEGDDEAVSKEILEADDSQSDENSDKEEFNDENSDNEELNDENSDNEELNDENSDNEELNDENSDYVAEDESEDPIQSLGCVKVIDDADFDFLEKEDTKNTKKSQGKLRALIITPTRELAVQVRSHLAAVLVHTDIKTAVVMGGVASQKQERLLRRGPDIVVGTPGRLWELIQQGNKHLGQIPDIRYLAVDETDRMVERGHFQELTQLLEMINSNKSAKEQRQTFVFSATLTIVHSAPRRLNMKRKVVKMTSELKIDQLAKIIGVKSNPKIVDVTRKFGTAESLTEARINCDKEEKDIYLYYFLKCFPGRTLVFCNSIDCVRRLQNLFALLQCQPQSLHASLPQKQRLKSLEKFSGNPHALLLATDVAARGLDIPNIQHVIHYHVPRTAETYIHRSGRTARAYQEGLSILLIESSELKKYRQLCHTLNRATDLPPFPVDANVMSQVKSRITLARTVEKLEHKHRKTHAEKEWFRKAAEEAELVFEEDEYDEDHEREKSMKAAHDKRDLQNKRSVLMKMLATPFIPSSFSGKYPTQTGFLVVPNRAGSKLSNTKNEDSNKALSIMKKESKEYSKLLKTINIKAPVKRVSKKKFKGSDKRKNKVSKMN